MYVWSKRVVVTLLAVFGVLKRCCGSPRRGKQQRARRPYDALVGAQLWIRVDVGIRLDVRPSAGTRKNVWVWLLPFLIAPLPTLMAFVLILQRRAR